MIEFSKLQSLIKEEWDIDCSTNSMLMDVISDSLEMMQLVRLIELRFGLIVPLSELNKSMTFGDLFELLKKENPHVKNLV